MTDDTGWRLEPARDCEGRTADHPDWATCCHRKGFIRYSLTLCTGDDSCRVSSHWTDPKYSGPHRERTSSGSIAHDTGEVH